MSKSAAGKKKQVASIIGGTVLIMALIYGLAIMPMHRSLAHAQETIEDAQSKLDKQQFAIKKSDQIQTNAAELAEKLDKLEGSIPKGDAYLWMLDQVQTFKNRADMEFSQIEPPRLTEQQSLPTLPYPNLAYAISGAAYYSDFGLFLADFENSYPYVRLRSLELEPTSAGQPGDEEREKLRFRFEFVTPAKPSTTK